MRQTRAGEETRTLLGRQSPIPQALFFGTLSLDVSSSRQFDKYDRSPHSLSRSPTLSTHLTGRAPLIIHGLQRRWILHNVQGSSSMSGMRVKHM